MNRAMAITIFYGRKKVLKCVKGFRSGRDCWRTYVGKYSYR